ncbi:MAG TPA: tripartite tricarboxylate transporter substrate-binding protein, partial [Quisquiliibacterium sp.]|nr:tripartite tricarboxylate transporter substrate-binding protein [Quisquiliibacterium sp.]
MTRTTRRTFLLAGAAAGLVPHHAIGQPSDYPNRPLKIIVPSPAGGLTDNYARMFAEHFTTRFNQPAVVENRPGASGIIGIEAMVKAPPDGYTIASMPMMPL